MLRMTDNGNGAASDNEFISIDQKKRQITFIEPSSSAAGENNANAAAGPSSSTSAAAAQVLDRAPMVSAPKIFAFDGMFTNADPQVSIYWDGVLFGIELIYYRHFSCPQFPTQNDVCTAALQDVIPAVLDGIDGCVLALGHPKSGNNYYYCLSVKELDRIINCYKLQDNPGQCSGQWPVQGTWASSLVRYRGCTRESLSTARRDPDSLCG